jgi:HD-GYP domain-containing protein (c-di-GMP phosphodiesterase class II)
MATFELMDADGTWSQGTLARPQGLLDAIPDGLFLCDRQLRVIDVNDKALEMLGVAREKVVDLPLPLNSWDAVREDGSPLPPEEHAAAIALATGEDCRNVVMGLRTPDRGWRWLSGDACLLVDGDRVDGVAVSFTDITTQRAEHRALRCLGLSNKVLVTATSEAELIAGACDTIVQAGQYALAWLGVGNDDERRSISIAGYSGYTENLIEKDLTWSADRSAGLGPIGEALRTGIVQVDNDLEFRASHSAEPQPALRSTFASMISIPLTHDLQPQAVLTIHSWDPQAFDGPAVALLSEMAGDLGYGIAKHRDSVRLEVALDGTLAVIARMTETRDPYTAGHQERVGLLSAAIAERLGMATEEVEGVRRGGQVHDVGKMGIAAEILSRPGRLDDLEFALVKRHPALGADILRHADLPWPLAEIAEQHHERIDGSGYPAGLRGEEICLPARIVAVADVVEAMAHHRPYRPSLGIAAALAEVKVHAGVLFDADVVQACLAVFEAGFSFPDEA